MKIIIVPSHNQSKNIKRIVEGYESQTILPDLLLFVFDRCSDDSLEEISEIRTFLNLKWIEKNVGENFSAGLTRDFGVNYVLENCPNYEMILFTDGDCVPSERVIEKHLENLNQSEKSVVSCGMRKMQDVSGNLLEDERLDSWVNGFSFTEKNGRVLLANRFTIYDIFTYSCNFAFNKSAIELCRSVNEKLSNESRVFNNLFDGKWGGEDNLISHILFRTGNWILLCDKESWVEHIYHEEYPKQDLEKRKMLVLNLSKKLEVLILQGKIEGSVQRIHKNDYISFGVFDINNDIKNTNYVEGLNLQLDNCLEYISEKYLYDKIVLKYLFTTNVRNVYVNGSGPKNFNLGYYKQLSGYLKFYLRKDDIVFEDDVELFKKNDGTNKSCSYCSLVDK